MDESIKKRVDESWKEQAEREKQQGGPPTPPAAQPGPSPAAPGPVESREEPAGLPEARFDLFVSGLAMEALIAMGDIPHPATRKHSVNLPQAKYLIDLLGVLGEKTAGNLAVEEEKLLKDALYQLRMRYLTKSGGVAPA